MFEDAAYLARQKKLLDEALGEAIATSDALTSSLPECFDVAALGVRDKAPLKLLSVRETLIWRTEELARGACSAIGQDDLTTAAILTRAIVESVAVLWKLRSIIRQDDRADLNRLDNDLMNIFAASRTMPERKWAYQILNFVDLVDKTLPGSRKMYDDLSEIAHPNWQGVAGMYSVVDHEKHSVHFGRDNPLRAGRKTQIAILLNIFLSLFEKTYNELSILLPEWIANMDPI